MITEEKRWSVDATLECKLCVKASVRLPDDDDESCQTVPVDTGTAPDAAVSGPRVGGVSLGRNGAHQTRHGTAVKCTQYCKASRTSHTVYSSSCSAGTVEFPEIQFIDRVLYRCIPYVLIISFCLPKK